MSEDLWSDPSVLLADFGSIIITDRIRSMGEGYVFTGNTCVILSTRGGGLTIHTHTPWPDTTPFLSPQQRTAPTKRHSTLIHCSYTPKYGQPVVGTQSYWNSFWNNYKIEFCRNNPFVQNWKILHLWNFKIWPNFGCFIYMCVFSWIFHLNQIPIPVHTYDTGAFDPRDPFIYTQFHLHLKLEATGESLDTGDEYKSRSCTFSYV